MAFFETEVEAYHTCLSFNSRDYFYVALGSENLLMGRLARRHPFIICSQDKIYTISLRYTSLRPANSLQLAAYEIEWLISLFWAFFEFGFSIKVQYYLTGFHKSLKDSFSSAQKTWSSFCWTFLFLLFGLVLSS